MPDPGAELVVPAVFRDRIVRLQVLGAKRAGTAYSINLIGDGLRDLLKV